MRPDPSRAVDPLIVATIGTALALGIALQETGGAQYIAREMADAMRCFACGDAIDLFSCRCRAFKCY
jgi:hypothetical protein